MQIENPWVTGQSAWKAFTEVHPELGYKDGPQQFYNFLRSNREALVRSGVLRRAKKRFWIAHQTRFIEQAFELSTGGQ
jgi:hypothetical protein